LTLQLFDARTGAAVSALVHPAVPVGIIGISGDGSEVYGLDPNTDPNLPCTPSVFSLLNARSGRVLQRITVSPRDWDYVHVGPNLHRLYTMAASDHINGCGPQWSYSPTITSYDLRTGKVVRSLRLKGIFAGRWGTSQRINGDLIGRDWNPGFALSPDGSQLAVLDGHNNALTLLSSITSDRRCGEPVSSEDGVTGIRVVRGLAA